MQQLIFYSFSAILLFSAMMVVTVRHPVRAVLFLILTFFTSAGLWMMLEAEFLALTLVLVYVGAVMVLFLFVVMMLDIELVPITEGFARHLPLGILVAAVITTEMIAVLGSAHFGLDIVAAPQAHAAGYSNTKEIGQLLYTVYVYPFEIASVILTVAIVAAIALTLRKKKDTKRQDVEAQLKVRKQDRLRIVHMPSQRKQEFES